MIVVTGAIGFIGSCLVRFLNNKGYHNLILVDNFNRLHASSNLKNCQFHQKIDRKHFLEWLDNEKPKLKMILHIGARTDTTETDTDLFNRLNLHYSQAIATFCSRFDIPLIYASSAATYGMGTLGFDDSLAPQDLTPLNPYGASKNDFDHWLLQQKRKPPFWAGLKFFNVYGPNEYHKGRMASVIWHCYHQIQSTGTMKLFRSHRSSVQDGAQSRDFIYIKDLLKIIDFMMQHQPKSGLYNLGTAKARSFKDLAEQTFRSLQKKPSIEYIDTPIDIRASYQYFTEATIQKLRQVGYQDSFYSLEAGIDDYIQQYLLKNAYY